MPVIRRASTQPAPRRRQWGPPSDYVAPTYNGFDHTLRMGSNAPQREAKRSGMLATPLVCDICGFSAPEDPKGKGYVFTHLEDYRYPTSNLHVYPVCKKCHPALHARFRNPLRWYRIVHAHYRHGAWFTLLTMDEADMQRAYDRIYPKGLPPPGKCDRAQAAARGLSREVFDPNRMLTGKAQQEMSL